MAQPFESAWQLLKAKKKSKPFHGYNPNKHSKKGGLNAKGRAKAKRETGANLKPPVTTKPSKLKTGSKKAKRRKSFCARMTGVKGPTSKKGKLTPKGASFESAWAILKGQPFSDEMNGVPTKIQPAGYPAKPPSDIFRRPQIPKRKPTGPLDPSVTFDSTPTDHDLKYPPGPIGAIRGWRGADSDPEDNDRRGETRMDELEGSFEQGNEPPHAGASRMQNPAIKDMLSRIAARGDKPEITQMRHRSPQSVGEGYYDAKFREEHPR